MSYQPNAISVTDADTLLAAYGYPLPENLIAQHPCIRGDSRLLVLDRQEAHPTHTLFETLPDHLPEGALLVANNSRVVPVRLLGQRPSGGAMECLLLTPLPLVEKSKQPDGEGWRAEADVLLRPSKNMRVGTVLAFGGEAHESLLVEVLAKGDFGQHRVRFFWKERLEAVFLKYGHLPLPPYIRRQDTVEDATRYQTVYARVDKAGSAAAPTAGLHFTQAMREALADRSFDWAEVTLHVGYGTFSPVRCADIRQHHMHGEFIEVPLETALAVQEAKAQGRPVVAVGTTACRTLEGVAAICNGSVEAFSGWTDIFIWPGYTFRVVDALITNFHLPESTLLMLVSALTGRERLLKAYAEAVEREYRFFSYGDAMLVK